MLSNTPLKISTLIAALSLTGCVETTSSQSTAVEAPEAVATAPAAAATIEDTPIVTANFGSGGGSWEGFGNILFRYAVIEQNNEVYICGAYTGRGSTNIRKLSREVMRQATATSNGQTILRNMRFFKEVSNSHLSTSLVGVETNCRSTGQSVDAVPLNSIRVQTHEGRYRVRT
ncbi:hypothetical protein DS901_01410 [Loktanella sp. D2R18]|uniref:hypothetical protein n=1 Tax=Rhodobacterales TaxID=204455 RepID=UPI000DEA22AE|nr:MULTISPECIES: hypothetical protein [Rhodobacterales]MDO6590054.1 hypothetical protein [Yoonia sp. 1_MG-2023]RBW45816.1 hypothetical protein DS901_01410 [Loktanella sp. D2R18]